MRLLIAEDDVVTARLLTGLAGSWGYDVTAVDDGTTALAVLQAGEPPQVALIDWMMPGLNGPEVCRIARKEQSGPPTYIILLTSRDAPTDVVAGLEAGADDYLVKPFDPEELRARLNAGVRIIDLQQRLAAHVAELEAALGNVRRLKGLLPICSYCKSIRDDSSYWHQVEEYVTEHSDAQFTHGVCPKCFDRVMGEIADAPGHRDSPVTAP
jgi:sigma-B regulation protein RsbU (phosphoserine phosphatase)